MARGDGGILDPSVHEQFIREYARQKGVNPDWVAAVAAAEGMHAWDQSNPNAASHLASDQALGGSFGDFQLNMSGLGKQALAAGIDPRDPNQWQNADKFAIDYIARTRDLSPWKGDPVAAEYIRRYGTGRGEGGSSGGAGASGTYSQPSITSVRPVASNAVTAPNITDISNQSNYRGGQLGNIQGFIWHHTGGGGGVQGVVNTLNQRGLGSQYIMDRDGSIYRFLPNGAKGAHILPSEINNLSNSNTEGMEVIAANDKDITPQQVASARQFAAWYSTQHPGVQYFGHGEVNPGHKEATEGATITAAIRQDQANGTTPPAVATAGTGVKGSAGVAGGAATTAGGVQPPAPMTPGQAALASLGQMFSSGIMGGGGGEVADTPDPAPIRMPALQGFEMPQEQNYLTPSRLPDIASMGGGAGENITQGAPSMGALASGETTGMAGIGAPMTGVGAESPLTFPTSLARYSRVG